MIKYVLATALGVGAGYYYARIQNRKTFDAALDERTAEVRKFYKNLYDQRLETEVREVEIKTLQDLSDPPAAEPVGANPRPVVKAARAMQDYKGISTPTKTSTVEEKPEEVQAENDDSFEGPYEITFDEFKANHYDYTSYSITYYVGDDILAGQSDKVIDEMNRNLVVGVEVIEKLKQGFETEGSDTLYVRSPGGKMEFEILRDERKYADVIGLPEE